MKKILAFLKAQALPVGMTAAFVIYMLFHWIPFLQPLKILAYGANTYILPTMVFVMLFTTFCKVNPKDMRFCKWHYAILGLQVIVSGILAFVIFMLSSNYNILSLQGALVCIIAPTGTAAAVIASRLGGNETTLTAYTIISNFAASLMIPLIFPLVTPDVDHSFINECLSILRHVFPLLICPFLAAWGLRIFFPKLHKAITVLCGNLAFYLWAVSLIIAIGLTLRSVVNSHYDGAMLIMLALSALLCCVWQFGTGKIIGRHYKDYISCGQGSGQKNTIFAIWISCTFLSPVVSVAPSSYIIWQNIVNSWQIWRKQRQERSAKVMK